MKQMLKFFLSGILIVFFCSTSPHVAAAANLPDGFLVGDDEGITISKNGGYFFHLEDLQPGDTITRKLIVKNTRDEDYHLTLTIEPKSKSGKIDLVEKMSMTILSNDRVIYSGNLSSDSSGKTVAKCEVPFGEIKNNSEQTYTIQLNVADDIAYWDYYSGKSEAIVDWRFDAKTVPSESKSSSTGGFLPKTNEQHSVMLTYLGMTLTFLTLIYIFVHTQKSRKRHIEEIDE